LDDFDLFFLDLRRIDFVGGIQRDNAPLGGNIESPVQDPMDMADGAR
jgi:hypothetical protein